MTRRRCFRAEWVLPVSAPPLRAAHVLVDESGRIARVARDIDAAIEDDVAITNLGAAALLPGLINVHAHPELCGLRGLLDDLPFPAWIPTLNTLKRDVQPTPQDYAAAARWTCIEALRNGITTLAATEDSGAALDALTEAGMRGIVFKEVFGPAPEQAQQSLADLRAQLDDMRARTPSI